MGERNKFAGKMRGKSLLERFLAQIDCADPDSCWNWTSSLHDGYGMLQLDGRLTNAHRVSYMMFYGEIPKDKPIIRHTCDNRACLNPRHLVAGTIIDNINDRNSRNRQARGESHATSRLTEKDVLEIRRLYKRFGKNGGMTMVELSSRYKVGIKQIYLIVSRKCWKHI